MKRAEQYNQAYSGRQHCGDQSQQDTDPAINPEAYIGCNLGGDRTWERVGQSQHIGKFRISQPMIVGYNFLVH
ncbi:hypothetical protein D3C76_1407260 [compost metagenome]